MYSYDIWWIMNKFCFIVFYNFWQGESENFFENTLKIIKSIVHLILWPNHWLDITNWFLQDPCTHSLTDLLRRYFYPCVMLIAPDPMNGFGSNFNNRSMKPVSIEIKIPLHIYECTTWTDFAKISPIGYWNPLEPKSMHVLKPSGLTTSIS